MYTGCNGDGETDGVEIGTGVEVGAGAGEFGVLVGVAGVGIACAGVVLAVGIDRVAGVDVDVRPGVDVI